MSSNGIRDLENRLNKLFGLKRVRKAVPKPTIAFKRKNRESRQQAKVSLRKGIE